MKRCLFTIASALLLMGQAQAQLSKGNPCKFLGNITTRGSIPSDYATMWEQLTPENETKWGSIANKEVSSVDEALRSRTGVLQKMSTIGVSRTEYSLSSTVCFGLLSIQAI